MNTILFGDAKKSIKQFKDMGLVAQTIVTSPPYYGLRSYLDENNPEKVNEIGNEETPQQFIENLVSVFRECKDILADDGTLWVNLGDSYYNYRPGLGQRQGKQSMTNQKYSEVESCNKRGNKLDGYKEKDLMGLPWELAFALRNDGWYLRQDIIWAKGISGQTRVGGGMPESVQDRCTKSHEYILS